MPFISIQSIYKRIAAVIVGLTERVITNTTQYYQGDQNGMCILSGDGEWMVTGSGPSPVEQSYPRVVVWRRTGGPGTAWEFFDELTPSGYNLAELVELGWGRENLAMTSDGSRIVVGGDRIYVFRRDGGAYVEEQLLPFVSGINPFDYVDPSTLVTFNTTTGVNASTDIITIDGTTTTPHPFLAYDHVIYRKNGGTANIGLTETAVDTTSGTELWVGLLRASTNGNTSVNDATNVITTSSMTNIIATGDIVRYVAGSTSIGGLTTNATYFARVVTSTQLTLHPTYADAIGNTNIIDVTPTGVTSQVHYFYNSSKIKLHPTQLDVQNNTNTIQLTSTGGETHTFGLPYTANPDTSPYNASLAIDGAGTRIVCNSNVNIPFLPPHVAVYERIGTVWSQTDFITFPPTIDASNPRTSYLPYTQQGIAISQDGSTVLQAMEIAASHVQTDNIVPNDFVTASGTVTFTYNSADVSYGNKPSITLTNDVWPIWAQPGSHINVYPPYRQFQISKQDVFESTNSIYLGSNTIPAGTALVYDKWLHPDGDIGLVHGQTYYARQYQTGFSYTFHPTENDALNNTNIIPLTPASYNAAAYHRFIPAGLQNLNEGVYEIDTRESDTVITVKGPVTWNNGTVVNPNNISIFASSIYFIRFYVNVLRQQSGAWTVQQSLYGYDVEQFFGAYFNLSCSADGNIILVGHPEGMVNPTGSLFIYEHNGTSWPLVQQVTTTHTNEPLYSWFGAGANISADGQHIVASSLFYGPYLENPANAFYFTNLEFPNSRPWPVPPYTTSSNINLEGTGKLFYYKRTAPTSGLWQLDDSFFPKEWYYDFGQLGGFVDITDAGDVVVASAVYSGTKSEDVIKQSFFGKVVTWETATFTMPTETHSHVGYILPEASLLGAAATFGSIHKLSADGTRVAAIDESNSQLLIYVGSNNGQQWTLEGTFALTASTISSIDIDDAGSKIVVSSAVTSPASSRVDTFTRSGSVWTQRAAVVNTVSPLLNFHRGVCISGDGLVLFASGYSAAATSPLIAAFLWNGGTNSWVLEDYTHMTATDTATYLFGDKLDASYTGDLVVASAAEKNSGGVRRADAFTYRRFNMPTTASPEWAQVANGGTGYTLGDVLTLQGGTPIGAAATLQVTGVSGGVITSVEVLAANSYSVLGCPTNPVSVTGGTGANATFTLWWDGLRYNLASAAINNGGSSYAFGDSFFITAGTSETFRQSVITVQSVNNNFDGVVTAITISANETYTSIPDPRIPTPIFTGTGTGLVLNLTWQLEAEQYGTNDWWLLRESADAIPQIQLDTGITGTASVSMSGTGDNIVLGTSTQNNIFAYKITPFTQNLSVLTDTLESSTPETDVGFGGPRDSICISKDGNTLAVGAWKTTVSGFANAGGVYVFKYVGFKWRQIQYIPNPCPALDDNFGITVALNETGTLLTVGSALKIDVFSIVPGPDPGCAVTVPTEQYTVEQFINPVSSEETRFGYAVAMTPDGSRMIVGGADAKVYIRSCDGWLLEQNLIPTGLEDKADRLLVSYGESVSINHAGNVIAIAAHLYAQTPYSGDAEGIVYIFTRTGTAWTQTASVLAPTPTVGERFGWDIKLNATGNVFVAGKYTGVLPSSTAFYLFRNISNVWTGVTIPEPTDLVDGSVVDYVENGANQGVIAFAARDASPMANRIYIYSHTYGSPDTVTLQATLSLPISPGSPTSDFGYVARTVCFSNNGPQYLVVSNPFYSLYNGETTGQVYVYRNSSTPSPNYAASGPWILDKTITPTNIGRLSVFVPNNTSFSTVRFGQNVYATSNADYIAVSSYDFSPPDVQSTYNAQVFRGGCAWVYEKDVGNNWTLSLSSPAFTPGPNGQALGGAVALSDDGQLMVLGGSDFPHATLTPITNDIDAVGQVQSFVKTPITNTPYFNWSNVQELRDPSRTSTSVSSVTVGAGSKSLTVQTGLSYVASQAVVIYNSPTVYMVGTVSSYNSGTGALVVTVGTFLGSGTYSSWTVMPSTSYFGEGPLALSKDGSTLAVAEWGSSYITIYTRGGSPEQWIQEAIVDAGITITRLYITYDGSKVVAWSSDTNDIATVLRAGPGSPLAWSTVNTFTSLDTSYGTWDPLALSGDGSTLFTRIEDLTLTVGVYTWNAGTTSWDLQDSTSIDATGVEDSYWGGTPPEWAWGLSCSSDGNWLVVTGHRYSDRAGLGDSYPMSTAYIYHRTPGELPAMIWSLHSIVPFMWYSQTPSLTNDESRCKITGDGSRLIWHSVALNRIFVIARDYNSDRHWNLEAVLTYEDGGVSDGQEGLGAYWGVDMSENGDIIVGGAPYWYGNGNWNAGRVIVWRKVDGKYRVEDILYSPNIIGFRYFGFALSCDAHVRRIVVSDETQTAGRNPTIVFDRGLEPFEMQPFPFSTYAIDDTTLIDLGGGDYGGHYYADPSLDAVQFNVRLCGESWEDTVNNVYYGVGLMYGSGSPNSADPRVTGLMYSPITTEVYDLGNGLLINGANKSDYLASSYPYGGSVLPGSVPQGQYTYPGVASSSTWYTLADYNEVPVYGKPASFEAWYSENETKTNQAVRFSGYTHFGDSGQVFPEWYPTVDGYVKRYVAGIIKRDADLATLSAGDIVYGILFNGTVTGGEGHIVVNGVIQRSIQVGYKPAAIWGFAELSMNNLVSDGDFGQYAQTFSVLELNLNDFNYNFSSSIGLYPGLPDPWMPLDTYDVKWAWYHHFIPDAGVGTYSGQVYCRMQTMFTHPGWPV